MRWLTVPLYNAQRAPAGRPYVMVICVGAGGSYFWSSNDRVAMVQQVEQPFSGQCKIRILNSDHAFTGVDLRGSKIGIGWGYDIPGSPIQDKVSYAPAMWVLQQQDISQEGELVTELVCIDIWQKLALNRIAPDPGDGGVGLSPAWGNPAKIATQNQAGYLSNRGWLTIRQIIDSLITAIDPPMPALYPGSADTQFNSYKPTFITEIGYPVASVMQALMDMTKSAVRVRPTDTPGGAIMEPLELFPASSESVDYTYNSDHVFFADVRDRSLTLPNVVYFTDGEPGKVASKLPYPYVGVFSDWASVAAFGKIPVIKWDIGIESVAEANGRAESTIRRLMEEVSQGSVIAPMNCGQELYDWVEVEDSRLNLHVQGRVCSITRTYNSGRYAGSTRGYTIELRLGGISSEVVVSTPDAVIQGTVGTGVYTKPSNTNWPGQPMGNTLGTRGMIPWYTDIVVSPGNTAHDHLDHMCHWHAGTIVWADNYTLSVVAGEMNLITTTYLFWDCSCANPNQLQYTDVLQYAVGPTRGLIATVWPGFYGSEAAIIGIGTPSLTVVTPQIALEAITSAKIADGAVVNRAVAQAAIDSGKLANLSVTTEKMANAIVTHDKMAPQAINHEDIRVGAIYGDTIAAGGIAADAIAAGAISADKIAANAVVADKIAANAVLSDKIMANSITAGHVALFSLTGFQLGADSIWSGHILAGAVTADKISVGQLSAISADIGTITAGKIHLSGLLQLCNSGGTEMVKMYTAGSTFIIDAGLCGYGTAIYHSGEFRIQDVNNYGLCVIVDEQGSYPTIYPRYNTEGNLGYSGKSWNLIVGYSGYFHNVYYSHLIPLDDYNDLELVKSIGTKEVGTETGKVTAIDLETLPAEVYRDMEDSQGQPVMDVNGQPTKAIHAGAMHGLLLGSIRQLISKVEDLEEEVKSLRESK